MLRRRLDNVSEHLANLFLDGSHFQNGFMMSGLDSNEMVLDTDEGIEDAGSAIEIDVSSSDDQSSSAPLATDFDVMRELIFHPLPEEPKILDDVVDTWTVTRWRSMSKKEHGPRFMAGGIPWRILLFPHGNNIDQCSIYLEHAMEADEVPENWSCCVQFSLVLWNPRDPNVYHYHAATHRFTKDESDWGFTRFLELRRMFNTPMEGYSRPICEDDSANITAYVRILEDETGVMWHNWNNYDSKKETGFVGLKNQGATCYLNSLIQSLYCTNAFRKAIYNIPTEDEADLLNSAYTLQRLFYQLQTSDSAISTNELTKSFGWETRHVFEQQDVQELSRKLMERMENKMKETPSEKVLPEMFSGKIKTYISCINVPYESSRIEDFWDIQLNVRGVPNLEASLRDYIQVEKMDGENQYFAGDEHKLQDANKGVIFMSFPEVLHLQLIRFEYDFNKDMMTKINDRYEFPISFDASPYLANEADRSESWEYQLHGVLVHQGDLTAGHYYAFIKPEKDGWFYKFDDDRASKATMREVFEEGFGGVCKPPANNKFASQRKVATMRANSAYMLVYIRKSRLDKVLAPVTLDDIPAHLKHRLEEETRLREERRKEREEAHLYTPVRVVTPTSFQNHGGTELAAWDAVAATNPAAPATYKILKSRKLGEFVEQVAGDISVEPKRLRLWAMVNRQNKTVRPESPLTDYDLTVEVAFQRGTALRDGTARLWVEVADEVDCNGEVAWPSYQPQGNNMAVVGDHILLFLKYYDIDQRTLRGICHFYLHKEKKVEDILPIIVQKMGWGDAVSADQLLLWEEIKPNMIEPLKLKQTLKAAELQDGDIVCCQRMPEAKSERSTIEKRLGLGDREKEDKTSWDGKRIVDARDYYDFLAHRVTVSFQAHPTKCDATKYPPFELELHPHRMGYDQLADQVAQHFGVQPTHIRFWTANPATGNPKLSIKRNTATPPMVATMLGIPTPAPQQLALHGREYLLYFEMLDMNLAELELSKNIKMTWLSEGITKETPVDVFVSKNGTIETLIQTLVRKLDIADEEEGGPIRVFEANQHKFVQEYARERSVISLNEYSTIFAERIPEEEIGAESNQFIPCFSFAAEPSRPHGVPFRLLLKEDEVFSETKKRLEKRTGLKGKLFEKVKFALVRRSAYSRPQYLDDDDRLWNLTSPDGDEWLGLDRPDRSRTLRNGVGDLFLR